MFQLDQADLDFGIYRIMNQKREEIEQFLDRYLLPQVKTAFAQFKGEDLQAVCDELDKRLESYEDALNNLQLKRSPEQGSLLEQHDSLREQYMLSYMLDVESAGSASLLNIDAFTNPFNYRRA